MKSPFVLSRCRTVAVASCSLLLVACGGGGGGGGGSADVALGGRLSLPGFAAATSGGGALGDGHDDDGHHAIPVRAQPLPGGASGWAAAGTVGPVAADPLDVRQVQLPAGRFRIQFEADRDDVVAIVVDPARGNAQLRLTDGRGATLEMPRAGRVDVAVGAGGASARWRWTCRPTAADGGSSVAFGAEDLAADDTLARYLGADAAMREGKLVVLFESTPAARGLDAAPATLDVATRVRGERDGLLAIYALDAAATAPAAVDLRVASARAVATAAAARRIAALPGVRSASPNYLRQALALPRTPNDRFWDLQWHFRTIGMEQAWDTTTGSSDVVVGVIDSGIVSQHPDFSGRLVSGYDFISDPSIALDGDGVDPDPEDPGDLSQPPGGSSWHGTHVAGTIGANGNEGVGVAGMDWQCRIVPIRALGRGGSGLLGDILESVLYAAGRGSRPGVTGPAVPRGRVDVLNMSLGGGGFSQPEQDIYNDARARGVLVVAAAGNDGTSTRNYPASYQNVLSVGATRFDDARTGYSNFADTVDVYAPGGDLSVDQTGDQFPDGVVSAVGPPGGQARWAFLQGTSMACPHVAGLAALLLAIQPAATPAQLESWIIGSCVDLGAPGFDPEFANGRIDAPAALALAANPGGGGGGGGTGPVLVATPNTVDFGTSATELQVALDNGGDGRAELDLSAAGFTFAPGSPSTFVDGTAVEDPTSPRRSHSAIVLTANRTGLAPGRYSATLVLPLVTGRGAEVGVSLEIPDQAPAETLFVLLIDEQTFETVAQVETDESIGLRWTMNLIGAQRPPVGNYWLVAGTDRDNDDFLGDEGELFGIWPFSDDTRPIEVGEGAVRLDSLDFALSPVDVLGNASGEGLVFRRRR